MLFTYPNKELLVFFFFFLFFKNVALARNPQCPEHLYHHLEARARVGAQPRLEPKVKSSPSAPSLRYLFLYGLLTFSFVNVKCLLHTAFFFKYEGKTSMDTLKLIKLNVTNNSERWCCESAALNMPANFENSAVATGLEKLSFHSNPKERQCQRMLKLPHNYTHLTR